MPRSAYKIYVLAWGVSIAIHVVIAAALIANMPGHDSTANTATSFTVNLAAHVKPVSPARLAKPTAQTTPQARSVRVTPANPALLVVEDSLPSQAPPLPTAEHSVPASAAPTSATQTTTVTSAQPHLELLSLVHAAIERGKHYPLSALRLQQQGTATINFVLTKDGAVKRAHVVKSSGHASLDVSAMQAVTAIEPFSQARHYIDETKQFSVEIVFKL